MLRIVRLSSTQFGDLIERIRPESRWIIAGLPCDHLYIASSSVLVVRRDDLNVVTPPVEEHGLNLSRCIQLAYGEDDAQQR